MLRREIFSEDHEIFRTTVRKFVDRQLVPHRQAWEADGSVPRQVWSKAGEAGLLCCDVPTEYGGAGGDFRHNAIVAEEMTQVGGGGPAFTGQSDIVAPYFTQFGTEAQKHRWLPPMARGDVIAAIAMTEPSAGSDLQNIRTTARREGDEFVINGQKLFISNGQQAHIFIVACKTDPGAKGGGVSLLIVEETATGFERGRTLEKIGRKAQDTVELFFSDVRVPASNLIGQEGRGFFHLMDLLPRERLSTAIRCVATAERALGWTVDYVKDRRAFGKRIADFQNTQFTLAQLWSETLAQRVLVDRCIQAYLQNELDTVDAAMAKLNASELEGRVLDQCLQFFGGSGYMWEFPIARAYADARVNRISAGSNHILQMIIGRALLK